MTREKKSLPSWDNKQTSEHIVCQKVKVLQSGLGRWGMLAGWKAGEGGVCSSLLGGQERSH